MNTNKQTGEETMNESYKDKFNAQMKKFGIDSLDDLKTDAEKKAFFKAVDKSHDAKNESVTEELLSIAEESINEMEEGYDGGNTRPRDSKGNRLPFKTNETHDCDKAHPNTSHEAWESKQEEMEEKHMPGHKEMKTGDDDMTPDALKLNAMIKDPHKSKEEDPKKDLNATYMKSDVRADVKNKGGADMAKVKDTPEMMTAMKTIAAMYKTEKYHDTKAGSLNDTLAQMHLDEEKTVTVKVKEFSALVETYLAKGGVVGNISEAVREVELSKVLKLKEARSFLDTYNRHFLVNYKVEEFIVRDNLEG